MMNYICEITSAILVSFVAVYGLNYLYHLMPHLRQELGSYRNQIIYTPIFFIIATLLVAKFLDSIVDEDAKIRSYFSYIKGGMMGIVIAYFGAKYWKMDRILRIDNPIMYYLYSVIVSIVLYGFVIEYVRKSI